MSGDITHELAAINDSLTHLKIAVSHMKSTSNTFTEDIMTFPYAEAELQMDFMLVQLEHMEEKMKEVEVYVHNNNGSRRYVLSCRNGSTSRIKNSHR